MSRKFQVGDKVRVIRPDSKRLGVVCTIIDSGYERVLGKSYSPTTRRVFAYGVDIHPTHGFREVAYEPHDLAPIYDGNEKVSWSECVWQPAGIVETPR